MLVEATEKFKQLIRQAQQKEEVCGRTQPRRATQFAARIQGVDALFFFALAGFYGNNRINNHLGTHKSDVFTKLLYGKERRTDLSQLAVFIEDIAGGEALSVFTTLNEWLETYVVLLDTLLPLYQFTSKANFALFRDTRVSVSTHAILEEMVKVMPLEEPNRFAKLTNQLLRQNRSLASYLGVGFAPATAPIIANIPVRAYDFFRRELEAAQKALKDHKAFVQVPAKKQYTPNTQHRHRYNR
jgi:hypothetical protein